ncbi:MAG: ribonucleotide-diphosphate reductase subunit beta, partial [Burkholderiaceae bacterium]|nr:ribonucleotide-diphosphate reductase subunit beta [Burkholderiaceae bacterium]
MLVWEEEIKSPTLSPAAFAKPRIPDDIQSLRAEAEDFAGKASSTVISDNPIHPLAAQPVETRRVVAAVKRIINGRTDVNQLVP